MRCVIISREGKREFDDVVSVTLPGWRGEMQVLPGHAESFVVLQAGEVRVEANTSTTVAIAGGVCHIKDEVVRIVE